MITGCGWWPWQAVRHLRGPSPNRMKFASVRKPLDGVESAASGGAEQNSVSIALKPRCHGTLLKRWSGIERAKPNQINRLSSGMGGWED